MSVIGNLRSGAHNPFFPVKLVSVINGGVLVAPLNLSPISLQYRLRRKAKT